MVMQRMIVLVFLWPAISSLGWRCAMLVGPNLVAHHLLASSSF